MSKLKENRSASRRRNHWNWLLALPALGLAFPAIYAQASPELFGFPFSYWYQIAWVIVSSLLTAIVSFETEK